MATRVQYYSEEERENLINQHKETMRPALYENILEGDFITFISLDEEETFFHKPQSDNTSIAELQVKVNEQDMVLEEIMFIIIPEIMGGGM